MNKDKKIKKFRLVCIVLMLITLSFPIQIYAIQPATNEDGYVIDNGSGNNNSITDAMRDYKDSTNPDDETMKRTISWSSSYLGLALSCIIWVYFAAIAFTTACDLAYITLPAIRPYLYDGDITNASQTNKGYRSGLRDTAASWANLAQQSAMKGDIEGANRRMNFANSDMNDALNNEARLSGSTSKAGSANTRRKLISNDLVYIMTNQSTDVTNKLHYHDMSGSVRNSFDMQSKGTTTKGTGTIVKEYLKKRTVSIIMAVTILLVFVSSSVFTDLGFNIGEAILRFLGF